MIKEDDDNYIDLSSNFNNFQDFLEFYIKRYHFEEEERNVLNEIIDIVNKENEDMGTYILNDFIEENYSYYNALALEVFELFINEFLKEINQYLEEDEIGFKLYLDDELNLRKKKI